MSHKINILVLVSSLLSLVFLPSCNREEMRVGNSIVGKWNITEIRSDYGLVTEAIIEQGELGFFDFGEDFVDYNFTRNDTVYSENKMWNLEFGKQRSGFFREPIITIAIEDKFVFDVTLSHRGNNSTEEDTESAVFFDETAIDGSGSFIVFSVEKE